MGGFSSLPMAVATIGRALPWAELALNVGQRLTMNRNRESAQRAQADVQIAQMRAAEQAEARQRAERLKRVHAAQRARFGAQGIDSRGGSAAALLDGLSDAAARDDAESRAFDDLRIGGLDDRLRRQRRLNLLEATTDAGRQAFGIFRRNLRRYGSLI